MADSNEHASRLREMGAALSAGNPLGVSFGKAYQDAIEAGALALQRMQVYGDAIPGAIPGQPIGVGPSVPGPTSPVIAGDHGQPQVVGPRNEAELRGATAARTAEPALTAAERAEAEERDAAEERSVAQRAASERATGEKASTRPGRGH